MPVQSRYPTPLRDQRQFFDELITEDWASYRSDAWDYTRRFEVKRLLRDLRPKRVLDVGCGCGFHDVELASYPFVERVEAVDYSVESIRTANAVYPHVKVFRRVADLATDDPGPVFDLVVSFQVIEHLPDPDPYFRYCLRACHPGAYTHGSAADREILDHALDGRRFDAVTFWNVLEHIENIEPVIGRAASLLEPGGAIYVVCPNYAAWRAEAHYQVAWHPLLSRAAFARRLRAWGKDPGFFETSIFLRTNWGVMRALVRNGLQLYDRLNLVPMSPAAGGWRTWFRRPADTLAFFNPARHSVELAARKPARP